MKKAARTKSNGNGTNLGFEATLWLAADKLCSTMDAGEYTHVVPGLIFIKYMSDAFQELHQQFVAETSQGADPDDPDEYCAENVFWVPPQARWEFLQANARQSSIGELVENVPPKGNATL